MEFPSLGVHCAHSSCSKLDFLPFECDCCHKIYCKDHRGYEEHSCSESYVKDIHVPVCPICNQAVPIKRGDDPNIKVNEHIANDCLEKRPEKIYANKCSYQSCKKKEPVAIMCASCKRNFCFKHRLETDHQCMAVKSKTSSSSSQASKRLVSSTPGGQARPQTTLMSQIGANLNRERMERQHSLQQPHTHHLEPHPPNMTEDEALACAIAASMDQPQVASTSSTHQPQANDHPPTQQTEQSVSDDEALARAIAASLDQQQQHTRPKRTTVSARPRQFRWKGSNENASRMHKAKTTQPTSL